MATSEVLERRLAQALDSRLAVFLPRAEDGSLLSDELALRSVAYLAGEIILPCCCLLCNKDRLTRLWERTALCSGRPQLTARLAVLVYDYLARCNGLG